MPGRRHRWPSAPAAYTGGVQRSDDLEAAGLPRPGPRATLNTMLAAAALGFAMHARAAASGAEYSFRWDPARGGPATAEQVFGRLGLVAGAPHRFEVRYFEVDAPADVPAGVVAILRQRDDGRTAELTYKLRGDSPWTADRPLDRWVCPLPAPQQRKDEVDVSFIDATTRQRAVSRSCSHSSPSPGAGAPAGLGARPKGCRSTMTRWQAGQLKVERWRVGDGQVLIEVSRVGADSEEASAAFADQVVRPLLAMQAQPEPRSKSALGADCR